MYTAFDHTSKGKVAIETYRTVQEAIDTQLDEWMEDENSQHIHITIENYGRTVATLSTGPCRDIAIVCNLDRGEISQYNVEYVMDENDRYVETRIEKI